MTADYSRWPTRGGREFAGVLLQQGRVLTDADWNEQFLTAERRDRVSTVDGLGRAVIPLATSDAFLIAQDPGPPAGLSIGLGRAYLDGLLVENRGAPGAFDPIVAELSPGGSVSYAGQPWLDPAPALPAAGPYVVYLKAWQRERTAVEDPSLIEPALGVDTGARLQTVWQIKAVPAPAGWTCTSALEAIPDFVLAEPPATGRLTTGTAVVPGQPDRCRTGPAGGYSGVENQLYRVEIHRGGAIGGANGATFKWSRDNGTVAARVREINQAGNKLVLDSIGRDGTLAVRDGDWIEVTDDQRELEGIPGELRRVLPGGGVDQATRTVTLSAALPNGAFPVDGQGRTLPARNTRVRRWDQADKVYNAAGNELTDLSAASSSGAIAVPAGGVKVLLEEGIVASFTLPAGGRFRTGDHWVFAARTGELTGEPSVEALTAAPPRGVHSHYAPLATVDGATITDCRIVVPPLGGLDAIEYVAGDGQEATPSYVSPQPILLPVNPTVGVARGPIRVAGRQVRFTIQAGAGSIDNAPGPLSVTTGLDGLADVAWRLDPQTKVQQLRAELLDDTAAPIGVPVVFAARLRTADEVAYDPQSCGGPTGPKTVQEALDLLCAREPGEGESCCAVLHVGDSLIDAIHRLAEMHDRRVCICLEAGRHEFHEGDLPELVSLSIHGPGATLVVGRRVTFAGIERLSVRDIAIVDSGEERGFDALVAFERCADVEITEVRATLQAIAAAETSTVFRVEGCGRVRVSGCRIVNLGGGQPDDRPVRREALPERIRALIDVVETNPAREEFAEAFRSMMAEPADVREAEASIANELAATRREVLGARAANTLDRLSGLLLRAEMLPPSRMAEMFDRLGIVANQVPREGKGGGNAVELVDGDGEVWLDANHVEGTVVLYGTFADLDFDKVLVHDLRGIPWDDIEPGAIPPLPEGRGHLRLESNTMDRVAIGAETAERLAHFIRTGEIDDVRLFESVLLHGNRYNVARQAIVGGLVTLGSNTFAGDSEREDLGFVYGNATIASSNIGPVHGGELLLAGVDRESTANIRMVVTP